MPDLFIHPQGTLPNVLRKELEATVVEALAAAMPCKPEHVIPHTVVEMGDAPLPERTVTTVSLNFCQTGSNIVHPPEQSITMFFR